MPEDHIGTVEEWEKNQDILKEAITGMGKEFVINEGDGAFYGPKLDFHLADALGHTWQCGTIQLDSQLPERFELEYTGEDGQKHRPVMIHRVVLGSIERFIGSITEHFAGAFPAWLAPVQVKVLPVTDRAEEYAREVAAKLDELGFRCEVDERNEKIGKKIREATLQAAITELGKDFQINPGDGAFYGPKLDFHLSDSLGRTWQCGTIQLDMQMPERFELEYVGEDGEKHRPIMIHRALLGSIERFIGVITEHFAGAFPTWLSPVQVKVLPVTDRAAEYAKDVAAKLDAQGFRVEVDSRNEKIGKKIREAQLEKIPYMLVVGDRDMEAGTVSPRHRADGDLGAMSLDQFTAMLRQLVDSKERK